jgi:hypothetical protein
MMGSLLCLGLRRIFRNQRTHHSILATRATFRQPDSPRFLIDRKKEQKFLRVISSLSFSRFRSFTNMDTIDACSHIMPESTAGDWGIKALWFFRCCSSVYDSNRAHTNLTQPSPNQLFFLIFTTRRHGSYSHRSSRRKAPSRCPKEYP